MGGRVCEYVHAKAIYNVLTQIRTVQKGGSNPRQITPWNFTAHAAPRRRRRLFENGDVL